MTLWNKKENKVAFSIEPIISSYEQVEGVISSEYVKQIQSCVKDFVDILNFLKEQGDKDINSFLPLPIKSIVKLGQDKNLLEVAIKMNMLYASYIKSTKDMINLLNNHVVIDTRPIISIAENTVKEVLLNTWPGIIYC